MRYHTHFWKKNPFVRLLPALISGILLQWHFQLAIQFWLILLGTGSACLFVLFFIPLFSRYKYSFVAGIFILLICMATGAILTWQKDIRNDPAWLGHSYKKTDALIVTINEPLSEKNRSFKADAKVTGLSRDGRIIPVKGRIILYFRKDSLKGNVAPLLQQLQYGSHLIFKKPLQEIRNSGNPGGFDYKRYALFKGITHQVFLKPEEFEHIPGQKKNAARRLLFESRESVLDILRKNINGEKELGLAEALLIGYKGDLEQSLVQSYTNTGVVHIIAISGLHLGLIYWLLVLLLRPLNRHPKIKWLQPVLIIICLWAFSLLAGAQPSVLRSALMFSFIAVGNSLNRKTSVYNSLGISAFILLCIDPYWLWDVGFQLSYSAVLSIVIFMRPIYNSFYFKNRLLDLAWQLNAVTLAAQLLTVPLSIYHFHQFPTYFILSNFLAVPLSSLILLGEILLCLITFIPVVSLVIGKLLSSLIWLMNAYIERVELIPGSVWGSLRLSGLQVILLFLAIATLAYWFFERSKKAALTGLVFLSAVAALRSASFIQSKNQHKIIVYNIPQKTAVDLINGREYFFIGDSSMLVEGFGRNFHLKPSRILHRTYPVHAIKGLNIQNDHIHFKGKRLVLLHDSPAFLATEPQITVDLLLISGNIKINMNELIKTMEIKQVVFDGSVPPWKTQRWKKECEALQVPYHDVVEKGAFVMNIR